MRLYFLLFFYETIFLNPMDEDGLFLPAKSVCIVTHQKDCVSKSPFENVFVCFHVCNNCPIARKKRCKRGRFLEHGVKVYGVAYRIGLPYRVLVMRVFCRYNILRNSGVYHGI